MPKASRYHQVRIHEPDIHKTAFKPQFELFEFTVLPFGFTAAPSTFQKIMNRVLQPREKNYVICCLYDILIHSKIQEDPLKRLREIVALLAENKFKLRMEKCNFALSHLDYLGHTVSNQCIQPNKKKIEAVIEWPKPHIIEQVQSLLGFCNFYRR